MKVAVIFHRLGPYHFARLRAAGRQLPVVAVETSGADETYAWDLIAGADGFERVTLFGNADAQRQPAREVASRMGSSLDKILPTAVAIPGWSDAAALAALHWCGRKQVPAIVMSESTEWDEVRGSWREVVKQKIVGLFSAALVGGTPHKNYLVKLGMPAERIFLGYDAVDNRYFQDKVAEVRSQKSEVGRQSTEDGQRTTNVESGNQKVENTNKFQLSEFQFSAFKNAPFFLASARFIEKKNLPRLIQAYALYRAKAERLKTEMLESDATKPSAILHRPTSLLSLVLLGDGELRPHPQRFQLSQP